MWDNISEQQTTSSCGVCECSSLLQSNFTLNSGGRAAGSRRAESRSGRGGTPRRLVNNISSNTSTDVERMSFDDENCGSPAKSNAMCGSFEDISFYAGNSPQGSPRPCSISPTMEGLLSPETSPSHFTIISTTGSDRRHNLHRRSFGEIDYNSVDSGYGIDSSNSNTATNTIANVITTTVAPISRTCFKFAEPLGVAPKRMDICSPPKIIISPAKQVTAAATNATMSSSSISPPKSTSCFRVFNSLSSDSTGSMDEDYMELLDMEDMDEDVVQLPSHFNSIISGDIKSSPKNLVPPRIRRCLSLTDANVNRSRLSSILEPRTPELLKAVAGSGDVTTPYSSRNPLSATNQCRAFKRPEMPAISPSQSKRFKCDSPSSANKENGGQLSPATLPVPVVRHTLRKSISMTDANIMSALARSSSEPDLIGDFSKAFCLPLMDGRHRDLKSISVHTMAKLMRGDYDADVGSVRVVDCRYPYEFEGGHIAGAENLYTQDDIIKALVTSKTEMAKVLPDGPKRNIIIFHCEFSSERGPKLSRFLRNHDRLCNSNAYPALYYPEVYLLHGGYKEFYESYAELCEPIAYRPMLEPAFGTAYKHFRAQTKSWSDSSKTPASAQRLVKSRSRLVL